MKVMPSHNSVVIIAHHPTQMWGQLCASAGRLCKYHWCTTDSSLMPMRSVQTMKTAGFVLQCLHSRCGMLRPQDTLAQHW